MNKIQEQFLDRALSEIPNIELLLMEVRKGLSSAIKTTEQTTKNLESLCIKSQNSELE